jgi:hypothetical protein
MANTNDPEFRGIKAPQIVRDNDVTGAGRPLPDSEEFHGARPDDPAYAPPDQGLEDFTLEELIAQSEADDERDRQSAIEDTEVFDNFTTSTVARIALSKFDENSSELQDAEGYDVKHPDVEKFGRF